MGKNLYIEAYDLLSSGKKIILARTIRRSGSTPRDVGSMCIITEEGNLIGTVGGGILEYKVQQQAMVLLKQKESFIYRFRLTGEDLAGAGMICGGDVDLFLEPLFPENTAMVSVYKAIKHHIVDKLPGILVTRIEDGIPAMDTDARVFLKSDGHALGTIPGFNPTQVDLNKNSPYDLVPLRGKSAALFVERISLKPRVFLFGAGHVSLFVAQLAKMVGFSITIIDDRPEFANQERFPDVDEILVTDLEHAFEHLKILPNSYILIITRGHIHDKVVLQQALSSSAAYIGMIGSTKKRDLIYRALMDEGFSKDDLEKVCSPIGLEINAETPEEIAVSIVGELIKKRAPGKKTKNLIS